VQDYKSLRVAVTVCATLVNIQTDTHRQHSDQIIQTAQPVELKVTNEMVKYMSVDKLL